MKKILVEVSARHVHLSQDAIEKLFGDGHELHPIMDLSQPGQYACEEKIVLKTAKGELSLRVLGPARSKSQVEISMTEARKLGIKTEIRDSGDLAGTAGGLLVGPNGTCEIKEGVIIAKRHIHMHPSDAEYYGVKDGDIVNVKLDTNGRSLIFGDTLIRVSKKYALAMHIDTDESNAANIGNDKIYGEIIKNI